MALHGCRPLAGHPFSAPLTDRPPPFGALWLHHCSASRVLAQDNGEHRFKQLRQLPPGTACPAAPPQTNLVSPPSPPSLSCSQVQVPRWAALRAPGALAVALAALAAARAALVVTATAAPRGGLAQEPQWAALAAALVVPQPAPRGPALTTRPAALWARPQAHPSLVSPGVSARACVQSWGQPRQPTPLPRPPGCACVDCGPAGLACSRLQAGGTHSPTALSLRVLPSCNNMQVALVSLASAATSPTPAMAPSPLPAPPTPAATSPTPATAPSPIPVTAPSPLPAAPCPAGVTFPPAMPGPSPVAARAAPRCVPLPSMAAGTTESPPCVCDACGPPGGALLWAGRCCVHATLGCRLRVWSSLHGMPLSPTPHSTTLLCS